MVEDIIKLVNAAISARDRVDGIKVVTAHDEISGTTYRGWISGDVGVWEQKPSGSSAAAYAVRKGLASVRDYFWIRSSRGYIGFIDRRQKLIVVLRRARGLYRELASKVRGCWTVKIGQPKYVDQRDGRMRYEFYNTLPSLFHKV